MDKIDKILKISKIAYYGAMVVVGIADLVFFGSVYLACTKKEDEEKEETNEDTMECN